MCVCVRVPDKSLDLEYNSCQRFPLNRTTYYRHRSVYLEQYEPDTSQGMQYFSNQSMQLQLNCRDEELNLSQIKLNYDRAI